MIKKSVKTIEKLSSLVFNGCNIQEFLDAAEDIIINPIWFAPLKEYNSNLWSKSYPKDILSHDYYNQLFREDNSYAMMIASQLGEEPMIASEKAPELPFGHMMCWVKEKENTYGIILIANTKVPHNTIDKKLVLFISLCLAHICSRQQMNKISLSPDEILNRLLSGQINSYLELSAHLPGSTEKEDAKWRLVVFKFQSNRTMQIGQYIRKLFKESLPDSWCNWNDRHFIALVDCSIHDFNRKGKAIKFLKKVSRHFGCPVCLSQSFIQLLKCRTYYERMISLPFFDRARDPEIIFFEDYPDFSLIYDSHYNAADLNLLAHSLYKNMVYHDTKNSTSYTETLNVYLNTGQNVKKAAERLCIHINTMQYRLNRMQELFDLDLSNEDISFAFLFAARLKRYIKE